MAWARLVEIAVGAILLIAAVSKAARMSSFARALGTYRFVPAHSAKPLAAVVVAIEGVMGVLLVSQRLPTPALAGATLLFVVFALVGWVESRRLESVDARADCGCLGGVVRLRVGRMTIAMNALIAAGCCCAALAFALTSESTARLELAGVADASLWAAAISLAVLYWVTSYAVSVIAVVDEAPGIPSVNGR